MNTKTNKKIRNVLLASSLALCSLAIMNVGTYNAKAAEETVSVSSLEVLGASVRLETLNATDAGIRFGIAVNPTDYATIQAQNYTVGVAVVFADYDEYQNLFNLDTHELSSVYTTEAGVENTLRYWDFEDVTLSEGKDELAGKYVATAAITAIMQDNLTTARVAYAYVKDDAGKYVEVVKGAPRSMTYTAQLAIEDPDVQAVSENVEFLKSTYIDKAGTTSYVVEHITVNDIGEVVGTQKQTVENATIGGQTAAVEGQEIAHYELDSEHKDNKASSIVYANENTVLKQYYKLTQYEVGGTVTANEYEGSENLSLVATNKATNKQYSLTVAADGKISGDLPHATFDVRALGYQESAEVTVDGANADLIALAPQTFEFSNNGFTAASYDANKTALLSVSSSVRQENWLRGSVQGVNFLQAGGRSRELYYENFKETEYSVGAFVSNTKFIWDNTQTLASSWDAKNSGISVRADKDNAVHIMLTAYGVRFNFGNISEWGRVYNYVDYKIDANASFASNKDHDGIRRGTFIQVTRLDNVLTMFIDGVKSFTLDSANGITVYSSEFESVTPSYNDLTTEQIKTKLSAILSDGVGNYVGYVAQQNPAGGNPENGAVFTSTYRSTDVSYFKYDQMAFGKTVTVNGTTLSNAGINHASTKVYGISESGFGDGTSTLGWGYNYSYEANTMEMQMVYIGGTAANVAASTVAHSRYFSNPVSGSFAYEATFDFGTSGLGSPALVLNDGTNNIYFSLDLDTSGLRLMVSSTVNGEDKRVWPRSAEFAKDDAARHVYALKLEVDASSQAINIYLKDVTANGEFTLLASIDGEKYDYGWNTDVCPSVGAILTNLNQGKQVAVGVGLIKGNSNNNVNCKLSNFKIDKLA